MSFIFKDELLNTAVRAALNMLYTNLQQPPPPHKKIHFLRRQTSTYNSLSVSPFFFKLNILVFYLLFCLKVYERWNSWTTSVHFYMALHLFLYVWFPFIFYFKCWIGCGRCVAVVHRLPQRQKKQNTKKYKKKRKKNVACPSLQTFQGWLNWTKTPCNLLYPLKKKKKRFSFSYASMPKHESSYSLFFPAPRTFFDSQNMNVHLVQVNYQ